MRDIKFRAWHPSLEKVFYNCRVSSGDWTDESTHFSGDHSTLMEYTGLKDSKGCEVYEGDIVQFKYGNNKELVIAKVEWELNGWGIQGKHPSERYVTWWADRHLLNGKCEVIGNIYENPKLLEGD